MKILLIAITFMLQGCIMGAVTGAMHIEEFNHYKRWALKNNQPTKIDIPTFEKWKDDYCEDGALPMTKDCSNV